MPKAIKKNAGLQARIAQALNLPAAPMIGKSDAAECSEGSSSIGTITSFLVDMKTSE